MTASPETVTDRMRAQVKAARHATDRRANASRPRLRRPRAQPADPSAPSLEQSRETQSLTHVFQALGRTYRRYRKQTRGPIAPGLRYAAYNFRAEPSLTTLVGVAVLLDELNLLD
jgi:hypothetical protein